MNRASLLIAINCHSHLVLESGQLYHSCTDFTLQLLWFPKVGP